MTFDQVVGARNTPSIHEKEHTNLEKDKKRCS